MMLQTPLSSPPSITKTPALPPHPALPRQQQQRKRLRRYLLQAAKPVATGAAGYKQQLGFRAVNFAQSVGFALEGLTFAFAEERNFRIDVALVAGIALAAWALQLPLSAWVLLVPLLGAVLVSELANTAMEWLVDLVTQGQFDLRAKRVKDVSAAMCLVVACVGYGTAFLVFVPYLWALLPR
jgi:diacylglycerol kinase